METGVSGAAGLLAGLRENAGWTRATGVLLLIFGVLSLASPLATGLAITVLVGIMLIVGGAGQCVLALQAGAFGRGILMVLFGLLMLLAGFFLVFQPAAGLASITLFLAAYFLAAGILAIIAAFMLRQVRGWVWMLANGVVTSQSATRSAE